MTTTAIGILLIVQCIVLWAIMAALHRHTHQLEAMRRRLDDLRPAQHAADDGTTANPRGNGYPEATQPGDDSGAKPTLRGLRR